MENNQNTITLTEDDLPKYNFKLQDDKYKATLDDAIHVREMFKKQNEFIFEMFNDKRIPNGIKQEYAEKYNRLKVKIEKEDLHD